MSNTSRIPKTEDQLIDAFHEQLDFICEACKLYDSGKPSRIKMAAPYLRTLFYHQRRGTILIELVDVDKKSFISYAPENINLMDMYTGPIFIDAIKRPLHTKPVPVYFPICYEEPPFGKKCDYDIWWEEPILKHFNTSFSRKNKVIFLTYRELIENAFDWFKS
ncbi:hypothetical protein JZO76_07140 [Enterococcus sp. MJM12]|uniref:Uncharacterized protein n=1 Tax=Candidatus Enterococcus myersii TaxID=2815322 RepID=A0ABS3H7B3_9ENTE|nr:hypothetical protein [Enterococcus sp. MJM12]MBO0449314.1 hypothetical protein [Enterococcus sp. MJM12]